MNQIIEEPAICRAKAVIPCYDEKRPSDLMDFRSGIECPDICMDVLISKDGTILDVSDSIGQLFGFRPSEKSGGSFIEMLSAPSKDFIKDRLFSGDSCRCQGKPTVLQGEFLHKDGGKIPCQIIVIREKSTGDGSGAIRAIIRDLTPEITYHRNMEARSKALDEYLYTVSHELKNPLRSLKGYLTLIENDKSLFDKFGDKLQNQADYLLKLMDRLLTLSRFGSKLPKKTPVDPEGIIRVIFATKKPAELNTSLCFNGSGKTIMGETYCLNQLFLNIIENSFKFYNQDRDQHIITVNCSGDENSDIIEISDNGIGVGPEMIEKIFDPGVTLDRSRGTGFGLAIARRIAEAHGGSISAFSKGIGAGISFRIVLPAL